MSDDIFHEPRTGKQVLEAVPGAELAMYSNLNMLAKIYGIRRLLSMMMKRSDKWIILLENPMKRGTGHWMGLRIYPERHEIHFFSTYGGKPDAEKIEWIPQYLLEHSDQDLNVFNDGLKQLFYEGWNVHYNDHPYQFPRDGTATCGIWTAGFLNSDLNPDQFYLYNIKNHLGAQNYFNAYFKRRNACFTTTWKTT